MGQAFTIKGLQTTIVLKTKENENLSLALLAKAGEVEQAHVQEKLANDKFNNSQADLKVEKEKNSKLENKGKVQKVLLWITGPLVVIESGWIAISTRLRN